MPSPQIFVPRAWRPTSTRACGFEFHLKLVGLAGISTRLMPATRITSCDEFCANPMILLAAGG